MEKEMLAIAKLKSGEGKFEKFYPAEDYHQDYYQENFINYLLYKKSCGKEKALKKIWN